MRIFPSLLSSLLVGLTLVHADSSGEVVTGNARFTVITPNLIRMEYALDQKFVDAPSWFAIHREIRDSSAAVTNDRGKEVYPSPKKTPRASAKLRDIPDRQSALLEAALQFSAMLRNIPRYSKNTVLN